MKPRLVPSVVVATLALAAGLTAAVPTAAAAAPATSAASSLTAAPATAAAAARVGVSVDGLLLEFIVKVQGGVKREGGYLVLKRHVIGQSRALTQWAESGARSNVQIVVYDENNNLIRRHTLHNGRATKITNGTDYDYIGITYDSARTE